MSCSSLRRFWPRGRRVIAVALAAALLALGALATPAPARAAAALPGPCPAAVPVSEVTAGLTGTGYTVSSGTTPCCSL